MARRGPIREGCVIYTPLSALLVTGVSSLSLSTGMGRGVEAQSRTRGYAKRSAVRTDRRGAYLRSPQSLRGRVAGCHCEGAERPKQSPASAQGEGVKAKAQSVYTQRRRGREGAQMRFILDFLRGTSYCSTGFDHATTKHDSAVTSATGPNNSFSPRLGEARLARVFRNR